MNNVSIWIADSLRIQNAIYYRRLDDLRTNNSRHNMFTCLTHLEKALQNRMNLQFERCHFYALLTLHQYHEVARVFFVLMCLHIFPAERKHIRPNRAL